MKSCRFLGLVLSGLLGGRLSAAEPSTHVFEKRGVTVPILSEDEFQATFGNDPNVPRTKDELLALVREFHPSNRSTKNYLSPLNESFARAKSVGQPQQTARSPTRTSAKPLPRAGIPGQHFVLQECGEERVGLILAGLRNPRLLSNERQEIEDTFDAGLPAFTDSVKIGHFKFFFTTNDESNADHNVSLDDIKQTAVVLNQAWDDYSTNFKTPKHYSADGNDWVDVKVYDCPYYGLTESDWDHIELSSVSVVRDPCRRQTTPVHELFHRVQYAYGYVSGTSQMQWATEATAAWTQKYRAEAVGDWMVRMNSGLTNTNVSLFTRSYDALPFWVFLAERYGDERQCVRCVWEAYQANGSNMPEAVTSVVRSKLGSDATIDEFVGQWSFANLRKDLVNHDPTFDYEVDELKTTCGELIYGPLANVPRTTQLLNVDTRYSQPGILSTYGADYYVFNVGPTVSQIAIQIKVDQGNRGFGYGLIEIKDGQGVAEQLKPSGQEGFTYTKKIDPGELSQIALALIGSPGGGSYTLTAEGSR